MHCYRYREIDPNIWISCTESLGVWIISYPSLFLQDVYLQYIGLALKDKVSLGFLIRWLKLFSLVLVLDKPHLFSPCFASKRAGVRIAFVHALKNLHEIDANVPSLGRFTRRFSSQMITLSGDIDISVAISETDLVKQLLLR